MGGFLCFYLTMFREIKTLVKFYVFLFIWYLAEFVAKDIFKRILERQNVETHMNTKEAHLAKILNVPMAVARGIP